jgi:hypothetical protein
MPGHLSGPLRILGHHVGPPVAASITTGQLIGIGIFIVVGVILLSIPVMSDISTAFMSKKIRKVAPRTLLLGGAILVIGIAVHVEILDILGGCLIGVIVVLAIFDNY